MFHQLIKETPSETNFVIFHPISTKISENVSLGYARLRLKYLSQISNKVMSYRQFIGHKYLIRGQGFHNKDTS